MREVVFYRAGSISHGAIVIGLRADVYTNPPTHK